MPGAWRNIAVCHVSCQVQPSSSQLTRRDSQILCASCVIWVCHIMGIELCALCVMSMSHCGYYIMCLVYYGCSLLWKQSAPIPAPGIPYPAASCRVVVQLWEKKKEFVTLGSRQIHLSLSLSHPLSLSPSVCVCACVCVCVCVHTCDTYIHTYV